MVCGQDTDKITKNNNSYRDNFTYILNNLLERYQEWDRPGADEPFRKW